MQGRADPSLSPASRAQVQRWRLPEAWAKARWLSSPLRRAIETAALLTDGPVDVEPRLIEMDWGAWEGRTLPDLRTAMPGAMAANEARGLDFRPEGGESPREVRVRLQALIADLAAEPDVILVTHKGVLRAALSLATGWDMTSRPPLRLADDTALVLHGDASGRLALGRSVFRLAAEQLGCEGNIDFSDVFQRIEEAGYVGHFMNAFATLQDMLEARDYR